MLREFGGAQFSTFKSALVDLAVAKLGPIGAEMKRLVQDPAYIDAVLADGSAARAGDRRRNHEGGQGHRRLRAAVNFTTLAVAHTVQHCALVPRPHAWPCHHCEPTMSSKRRSYEAGHKPKYLVVIDDTEECDRAVYWAAARRAHRSQTSSCCA